jgi:hypothetical protein
VPTLVPTHGRVSSIYVSGTDASPWLNAYQFQWGADTAETTAFGASSKSFITGFPNGQVTLSGPMDMTQTTGGDAILSAQIAATTPAPVSIVPVGGGVQNNRAYVCSVYLNNDQIETGYADVNKFTSNWSYAQRMGAGLTVQPAGTLTAPGSFPANVFKSAAGADYGAATTTGGIANLHVIQNTLNQTLTVQLIHDTVVGLGSSANVPGGGFTAVAAGIAGSQSLQIAAASINRYVGITATTAGAATGTCSIVVTFARYSY